VLLLKISLEILVQAEDVLNKHKRESYTTFLSAGTFAPGMIPVKNCCDPLKNIWNRCDPLNKEKNKVRPYQMQIC
jgi:hypothetical protein